MYSIIYLYKQNLINFLSKLRILASHATIGVPVSFCCLVFFEKKMVLNYGYIQGVPKGMNRFLNLNKSSTFKLGIPKYPNLK